MPARSSPPTGLARRRKLREANWISVPRAFPKRNLSPGSRRHSDDRRDSCVLNRRIGDKEDHRRETAGVGLCPNAATPRRRERSRGYASTSWAAQRGPRREKQPPRMQERADVWLL